MVLSAVRVCTLGTHMLYIYLKYWFYLILHLYIYFLPIYSKYVGGALNVSYCYHILGIVLGPEIQWKLKLSSSWEPDVPDILMLHIVWQITFQKNVFINCNEPKCTEKDPCSILISIFMKHAIAGIFFKSWFSDIFTSSIGISLWYSHVSNTLKEWTNLLNT